MIVNSPFLNLQRTISAQNSSFSQFILPFIFFLFITPAKPIFLIMTSSTSYQPLINGGSSGGPHPQQRKAYTFTLMIMMVAFATLLTIIRLTISPDLSGPQTHHHHHHLATGQPKPLSRFKVIGGRYFSLLEFRLKTCFLLLQNANLVEKTEDRKLLLAKLHPPPPPPPSLSASSKNNKLTKAEAELPNSSAGSSQGVKGGGGGGGGPAPTASKAAVAVAAVSTASGGVTVLTGE